MRRETADYLPFHTDCYTTVVRKLLPPIEKNYVQNRRDRRPRLSVYLVVFFGSSRTSNPTGTRKFQNFTKREDTILPYGGWGFIFAFDLSIVPFLRLVDCFFLSTCRLILPFERTRGLNLSQNSPSRIPIQNHPKAVVDAFG